MFGPFESVLGQPVRLEAEIDGGCASGVDLSAGLGHRDVELGYREVGIDDALELISRICCWSSVSHSYAFCRAVESACGISVSEGHQAARALLAEYERIASHLRFLSLLGRALCDDILFMGPRRYLSMIRKVLTRSTGNPFSFDALVPGGVHPRVDVKRLEALVEESGVLERDVRFWRKKLSLAGYRLSGAHLGPGDTERKAVSAVAFRAAGSGQDSRVGKNAYGYYRHVSLEAAGADGGKAIDRAMVVLSEVVSSLGIIGEAFRAAEADSDSIKGVVVGKGSGTGVCESPPGAVEHRVFLSSEGEVIRNRVSCAVDQIARLAGPALSGVAYQDLVPSFLTLYICASCLDR